MAPRMSVLFIKLILLKNCLGFLVRHDSFASSSLGRLPIEVSSRSFQRSTQRVALELKWRHKYPTKLGVGAGYEVQYGDTAGAALAVRNTMLSRGSADILMDVNWRVMLDEHWAIVGPNGETRAMAHTPCCEYQENYRLLFNLTTFLSMLQELESQLCCQRSLVGCQSAPER